MITLDQVLLLQEKVESAVKKISSLTERISQLEASNDALSRKCLELTNALEEKTELVSTLESAQDKIEESILKTINRLDSVEDALLGDSSDKDDSPVSSATEETDDANIAFNSKNAVNEEESGDDFSEFSESDFPENSNSLNSTISTTEEEIVVEKSLTEKSPDQQSIPSENSSEEPFAFEQSQSTESHQGLLNKSEMESHTMEQAALQNAFSTETKKETPAPSALDGQFDIF